MYLFAFANSILLQFYWLFAIYLVIKVHIILSYCLSDCGCMCYCVCSSLHLSVMLFFIDIWYKNFYGRMLRSQYALVDFHHAGGVLKCPSVH